jgi:uncharacterized membrane protein
MLLLIVKWFLVILFGMAGLMKMMTPKKKFEKKMPWAKNYTEKQLHMIGLAELLGALGLILPVWLDFATWLMPLAALGLGIVALLAVKLHVKLKENGSAVFAAIVAVLALWMFWQNLGLLGL